MQAVPFDRELALFREGEKLATIVKTIGRASVSEIADDIARLVTWKFFTEEEEDVIDVVIQIIKVYQGFLDNGGEIDFTRK